MLKESTTDPAGPVPRDAHIAVVDLGSNSIRLVVYDSLSRAPFPRFNEKSLCRLGANLEDDGSLNQTSMQCVERALVRFAAIAKAMDVHRIDLLATEAIRNARNGADFQKRLESESGLKVSVLSGAEEARLAALGVLAGFHQPDGLVGDLGGGSLELAEIRQDHVGTHPVSMPLGALRIQPRLAEDPATARDYIDEMLKQTLPKVVTGGNFYIVGGNWRALGKVHLATCPQRVPVLHGLGMDARELRDLAKKLWRCSEEELAKIPGVPGRRLSSLPAAAMVLERVLKQLKPSRVLFSALGVREGWLYDLLDADTCACDPLITGCRLLEAEHARVPEFSAALERWSEGLFIGENSAQRRLRIAVIALSDIAWRERSDVQPEHAFERILRFPFIGVSHVERVFLAAAVHSRYGKAARHDALELLSSEEADRAHVLGTLLLLGYRFSGSVAEILDQASIEIDANTVTMKVDPAASVPDSDAVKSRLALLAKALGRENCAVVSRD